MLAVMPKRIRLFVDTDIAMRNAVNLRAMKVGIKAKDLLLQILQKEFAKELAETRKFESAKQDEDE